MSITGNSQILDTNKVDCVQKSMQHSSRMSKKGRSKHSTISIMNNLDILIYRQEFLSLECELLFRLLEDTDLKFKKNLFW